MEKYCPLCDTTKPSEAFHKLKRANDGLQRWCKQCSKTRSQKYYSDNKELVINRKRQHKANRIAKFEDWKKTLSCIACQENDSCCLEFHHISPNEKEDTISNMVYSVNVSWLRLMTEVAKCVVLCSNCHKKVHKHGYLTLLDGSIIYA